MTVRLLIFLLMVLLISFTYFFFSFSLIRKITYSCIFQSFSALPVSLSITTQYTFIKRTRYNKQKTSMSNKITPSLRTIPVELVCRILDNLDPLSILLSLRNVCTRLNVIIDTYPPYQVNFSFIFNTDFHSLRTVIHDNNKLHFPYLFSAWLSTTPYRITSYTITRLNSSSFKNY
jgi:hypothetical protein